MGRVKNKIKEIEDELDLLKKSISKLKPEYKKDASLREGVLTLLDEANTSIIKTRRFFNFKTRVIGTSRLRGIDTDLRGKLQLCKEFLLKIQNKVEGWNIYHTNRAIVFIHQLMLKDKKKIVTGLRYTTIVSNTIYILSKLFKFRTDVSNQQWFLQYYEYGSSTAKVSGLTGIDENTIRKHYRTICTIMDLKPTGGKTWKNTIEFTPESEDLRKKLLVYTVD